MTKEQEEKIEGMTDEQLIRLLGVMIADGLKYQFSVTDRFWVKKHMCEWAQEQKREIESDGYVQYGNFIAYFNGEYYHGMKDWRYFKKATEKFLENNL